TTWESLIRDSGELTSSALIAALGCPQTSSSTCAPDVGRHCSPSAVRRRSAMRLRPGYGICHCRSPSPTRPRLMSPSRLHAARPEVNFVVRARDGAWVAQVDLAFVEFRMALEYEGDHHRTDRDQWRSDLRRVPRLEDEQWHTTRMGPSDLEDSRDLIARLARR